MQRPNPASSRRLAAAPRGLRLGAVVGALLAAVLGTAAQAAPYTPAGDDTVVATLPQALAGSAGTRERALRQRLQQDRRNLPLALAAARQAIDTARREGDPRALGQAQAALSPWWAEAEPPAAARLLRAVVQQSLHAFGPALQDLDALLREGVPVPLDIQAQARLTRASIHQVQGRLAEAERDCIALAGPAFAALGAAAAVPAEACRAELAGLQGRADEAERRLQRLAATAGDAYAGWIALMRAELAERRGDRAAEAHYRAALAADDGVYPRAALADWLLAEGRARDALAVVQGRENADALLLRAALAQRASGDARAAATAEQLRQRFAEARARGDGATHAREEARFALEIDGDAARALALAQANWAVQREAADGRLLAAAAQAARRAEAAEPLREHLRRTGGTDARLARGAGRAG